MRFSYNWLKEYVDIKKTPEELAEILTMRAFEAEGVERAGKGLENIVIGEVMAVEKHPNADRLKVTNVNIGNDLLQIVCGAPNVAVGQKVAVALAGAKLPSGMTIEAREVRGVKSAGMICAEDELGLGNNHEGIMVLSPDAARGAKFTEIMRLNDAIIDFSILPDRAHDVLSYWGVSQEIAAVTGKKLKKGIYENSKSVLKEDKSINIKKILMVENQDKELCRRYSARVINNISVAPSPDWLKARLEASGIRPINNLVDIGNYVMLETGQPLHIFDLDKIESANERTKDNPDSDLSVKKIIIRKAKKNESILVLDGKEYKLDESILVIADEKKALAIAGIMGGESSAVSKKTKNIVIEAANFEPVNIRRSSTKFGLVSDSSYRFQREPDRNLTAMALDRAAELISDLAGGQLAQGAIDIYPVKTKPRNIKLEFEKIEKLLGIEIPLKKTVKIFSDLGFKVKARGKSFLDVTVPTRRLDITGPIELIREVARIYGYDNIKSARPSVELALPAINFSAIRQNEIKKNLAAIGFTEVYNYSFIGDKEILHIGGDINHYWELANPLSPEHKYLRKNLLPGLLNNIAVNSKISAGRDIKIFEIGNVFSKFSHCLLERHNLPEMEKAKEPVETHEKSMVSGAIWSKSSETIYYDIKNALEIILARFSIRSISFTPLERQIVHFPVWHLKRTAAVEVGGETIGVAGEIDPKIITNFGIEGRVGAFNLNFEKLFKVIQNAKPVYAPIGKFPSARIDLAIIVAKKILWKQIEDVVVGAGNGLIKEVELFDIYEGKNIPPDKRSLAFHVVFQSSERTLKDDEVKKITDKIIERLQNNFGAILRTVANLETKANLR